MGGLDGPPKPPALGDAPGNLGRPSGLLGVPACSEPPRRRADAPVDRGGPRGRDSFTGSDRPIRPFALPELTMRVPVREELDGAAGPAEDTGVLREAHRIARAIVDRASERARDMETAAAEHGREVGLRAALEQEGPALRAAAGALADAAARLESTRRELERLWRATLPRLGVTIAERVLRHELTLHPERLVDVIGDALGAIGPSTAIAVRLHPDDVETVHRHRQHLADVLGGAELRLEADPGVGRGGCVLESESLTLPAGIPEQLERALDLLTETER
jgi:flagellar assembly protein FliH